MTNPTLLALAEKLDEAAEQNADAALGALSWDDGREMMAFAAHATIVADSFRARFQNDQSGEA